MLKEFRDFILQGDVVALAIAIVIGVAFGAVITSFVADLLTPLIAAIGGQPDFADLTFTVNNSVFRHGLFVNAVISFLIIAAVVFFLVYRSSQPPPRPLQERGRECCAARVLDAHRSQRCRPRERGERPGTGRVAGRLGHRGARRARGDGAPGPGVTRLP